MHGIGRRGRVEQWRDGKRVATVGCMGYESTLDVTEDGVNGCFTGYYGDRPTSHLVGYGTDH